MENIFVNYRKSTLPKPSFEDIKPTLSVNGKNIIREAWTALANDEKSSIKYDSLAVWLCGYLDMEDDKGNGSKTVDFFKNIGLLSVEDISGFFSSSEYVCYLTFKL